MNINCLKVWCGRDYFIAFYCYHFIFIISNYCCRETIPYDLAGHLSSPNWQKPSKLSNISQGETLLGWLIHPPTNFYTDANRCFVTICDLYISSSLWAGSWRWWQPALCSRAWFDVRDYFHFISLCTYREEEELWAVAWRVITVADWLLCQFYTSCIFFMHPPVSLWQHW